MADPVEIIVEPDGKAGDNTGDWIVRVGRGQGGKIVSRHLKKPTAVKRGRAEGRKREDTSRGATLWVKNLKGRPRKGKLVARYGKAQKKDKGSLFGFF